ncbi:MAG: formylglycine-generating enzyme family protein [Candidatus Hydrogenedentes bacterium]|nr:formylglycine-generating enzyme family protein [Candidatus Hydrogenedentota bacterium]
MKHVFRSACGAVFLACLVFATGCPFPHDTPIPGETRIFDGIEFQWCPPGSFMMGSPLSEVGRFDNETRHRVVISQGFWLGKYEVTQAQWVAVTGSNPSYFSSATSAIKPVEQVSWDDVQYFLAELNANKSAIGGPYRLPTDAEWEYAYRAKTTARFYWGEDPTESDITDYAWYLGNASNETHNVGEMLPNDWGLYDMGGNVDEWCQDWYADDPDGSFVDPQGPATGTSRVARGGSWNSSPAYCRAALRDFFLPSSRNAVRGFRLLRIPD